jgi:hypothetical protein
MTKSKLGDLALLALFPLIFVLNIVKYFWVLPDPSDPLEYIGPIPWKNAVGFWPWLDRINLGSGLAMAYHLLPGPAYITGPLYALLITTLTLIIAQYWLYRRVGFVAALAWGVFVNSGWYFLYFGTQIFPEPTMLFYALLTALCFLWSQRQPSHQTSFFLTGLFAAMACFSKVTAILLPLVLAIAIFKRRRFGKPTQLYVAGLIGGALLSAALFCCIYGNASLLSTIQMFFGANLKANYAGRGGYNNAVSYYDVITDRQFLPIFLGLLVSIGAYRHKQARALLLIAWSFIATIYLIYVLSDRGYTPIPNYIYPGFFFAALGLSAYFGSLWPTPTRTTTLALTLAALFALTVGLRFGVSHNPSEIFVPGYYPNLAKWVKMLFNLGILALVVLLVALEVKPSGRRVTALLLVTAFWTSAYAGGKARHLFASLLIPNATQYYSYVGALNRPTAQSVDLFVDKWIHDEDPTRILWLYRVFFNERYDRSHGRAASENLIMDSIKFKMTQDDLVAGKGEQILTDQPDIVAKALPSAQLVDSYEWNGLKLSVFQRGTAN